jgi:hypothetical protein
MPQQFPRRWCPKKKKTTVKSRGEVEKAGHHDEGYCDGFALPRHEPTKKKQSDFGIINSKTRGACVITRI